MQLKFLKLILLFQNKILITYFKSHFNKTVLNINIIEMYKNSKKGNFSDFIFKQKAKLNLNEINENNLRTPIA